MCSVAINGAKGEVGLYKPLYYGGRVNALNGTLDEDAAANVGGLIVRDGTVNDVSGGSERATFVGDAAAAAVGCVVRDSAVAQCERACIVDTAAEVRRV